eukprot:Tbor_TRINITY_DN2769_c0_g1::TRINITY_DN2769_c0_g1_i1::g.15158::m.15158
MQDFRQQPAADSLAEEDPWREIPKEAQHLFHVFEARSARNSKTVSIEMPSPAYKMLCGSCVAVGNTMIIGSYPETASKWTVVHDPARRSACVILKVIALIEENEAEPNFETTIKRLALSSLMTDNTAGQSSFFSDFDPSALMNIRGKKVTLNCPIPSKYTLCGGGFYSPIPVISSIPYDGNVKGYSTRGKRDMMSPGAAWTVECDKNPSIVAFAVGIRAKAGAIFANNITENATEGTATLKGDRGFTKSPARDGRSLERTSQAEPGIAADGSLLNVSPNRTKLIRERIYISLLGPTWEGRFPGNYGNVCFNLGACNYQDPAAAALFVVPNDAAKAVLSKAPPTIWTQVGRPITKEERDHKIGKFCSISNRKKR